MDDQAPAAKRPKIRLACRQCRDRKIRCDGGRPRCDACARKNLGADSCVYVEPSNEASTEYVRSLESRIRELENTSSQPRFHTPPQPLQLQPLHLLPADSEGLPGLRYEPRRRTTNAALQIASSGAEGRSANQVDSRIAPLEASHRSMSTRSPVVGERPSNFDDNSDHHESGNPHGRSTMGVEGLVEDGASQNDGSSVYLGRSSAAAFINEVRGKARKRRPGHEGSQLLFESQTLHPNSPASQISLSKSKQAELEALLRQLVLPPRRVADHHLEHYWKYIYPFNPILHQLTFKKRYEEIWSQNVPTISSPAFTNPGCEDPDVVRAFYGLFNILLALGSLHSTPDRETVPPHATGDTFYDRAEQLMSERSMNHNHVLSVQVFILMAHYLQITGRVNKCWVMVGTAIRVAQGLGIHLSPRGESQAQQQERRRTWASCLQMDRIVGMMFGRPPMVGWSSADPIVDLTDDELLSTEAFSAGQPVPHVEVSILGFFVHSIRYTEILLEVLKVVYAPQKPQDVSTNPCEDLFRLEDYYELLRLDSLLSAWHRELPTYLIANADQDLMGNSTVLSQAIAMLCRYLHLKMLLFRAVTVKAAKTDLLATPPNSSSKLVLTELQRSVVTGCVHSCIFAAQDIIKVTHVRCVRNSGRLPNWWYPTFYIFTAGTVLLAVRLSRHTRTLYPESATPLETLWRQAMEILAVYEEQGSAFARQCGWTLKIALEQGLRDATSSVRSSREPGDPGDLEVETEGLRADEELQQAVEQNEALGGGNNLADTILEDDWWQTGGLAWLDSLNVPQDFSMDGVSRNPDEIVR